MNARAKPRILLVGNYRPDDQRSMLGYEAMLAKELAAREYAIEIIYPTPKFFPALDRRKGFGKFCGYLDKFVAFPFSLWRIERNFDVVIIVDHSNAMYVPRLRRRRYVLICHDVFAIRCSKGMESAFRVRLTGRVYQFLILRGIKRADRIVCVSEFTKSQLLELSKDLEGIVSVARSALRFEFSPRSTESAAETLNGVGVSWKRYFINVGSIEARKNRRYLAEIFSELLRFPEFADYFLIIVGPNLDVDYPGLTQALNVSGRIKYPLEADDEALANLYSGASALIFPSKFEGFGWPIIEAQACGCPTFTADIAPMNEIGGSLNTIISLDDAGKGAATIYHKLNAKPVDLDGDQKISALYQRSSMIDAWIEAIE